MNAKPPAGQRLRQISPARERCARCQREIPAWTLYFRHAFQPDGRDPQGLDMCCACYDRVTEAKPV